MVAPVRLQFDALEKAREAHTGNISIGGMFVQGEDPRPVGTLVRFELRLEGEEPIQGVGEVVWIRPHSQGPEAPPGMGIQFGHLEDSPRERLKVAVLGALADLGIDSLSEPTPEAAFERSSSKPRESPPPDLAVQSRKTPSSARPGSRAKSRSAKTQRSRASRSLKRGKDKAQPAPLAMSGRTKTLIVILGLLALLLILLR